jgi:multidrug efflux pump subunit AcrA (membrane-fusion protein)
VATVQDGRVHLTKVTLGRDYGTEVEVLDGLDPGAVLVVNPSDEVSDGAAVRTVKLPPKASTEKATTEKPPTAKVPSLKAEGTPKP